MTGGEAVAQDFELRAQLAGGMGCAFYRDLLPLMAADARAEGAVWSIMEPFADAPFDDAYALRLLGGLHHVVLGGEEPELARHYPSTGGDADAAAAWPLLRALIEARPPSVATALAGPPQTNEVGRSAALVGGMLTFGAEAGRALRLRELGSSAGLNLRVDSYRYEQAEAAWGDTASAVRFRELWSPGVPPFGAAVEIADRKGCDLHPIDAGSPHGARWLLAYVWPGQTERLDRLRAALDIASRVPVTIEREDVGPWCERELRVPVPDRATLIFHSIFWQYLPEPVAARVTAAIEAAGDRATADAPIGWLRLEPSPTELHADLRLRTWPGGADRLLATAGFHDGPVRWLA